MTNSNLVLFEYFLNYADKQILLFVIRSDFTEPKIIKINKDPTEIRDYIKTEFKLSHDLSIHEKDIMNNPIYNKFHSTLSCIVEPILYWVKEGEIIWLFVTLYGWLPKVEFATGE